MAVPKLRFKEFDGDWSPYVLKDFVSFRKGKGISKADISENGINECIRYGELYTTYGQVIDHIHSKTNVSKSECILSKAGDVIIPASGETQIDIATASCVLYDDIILSGDLNILSHEENGSWLAYYLSSAKKLEIAQLAQGNSVVHLYSSQLKDLKINKPSKEEQTRIASFLSNVDEKISQLTQKHALLSQYKQGMMQKLFSQQLRFKADDGSEFGEWEEIALGKIKGVSIASGKSSHEKLELAKYYYYGSTGVIGYSNEYDYQGTRILIARVGHNAGYIYMVSGQYNVSDNTLILELPSNLDYIFIRAFLEKFQLNKLVFGTGQPLITGSLLKKVVIQVPCLEEQTKIANFLSAIDQKIEVVAQQIEQAKTWKKGLLQQMFV